MKYKGEKMGAIETLIGMDVHIKGDLASEKEIRIEGKVDGNISSKSKVIIGNKAHIVGNVQAQNITIYGRVNGNVEATDVLEVMETGEIYGETTVQKLYVALGGILSGECKMKKEGAIKKQQIEKS